MRFENFQHASRAFTAGNAFAATFGLDEFHEVLRKIDHAGGFVHDNQPARAHDGAELLECFVVGRKSKCASGTHPPEGPPI